ncbi:MYXO-CTERM sorting domain-containing protein [Streptomyces misionensis]
MGCSSSGGSGPPWTGFLAGGVGQGWRRRTSCQPEGRARADVSVE